MKYTRTDMIKEIPKWLKELLKHTGLRLEGIEWIEGVRYFIISNRSSNKKRRAKHEGGKINIDKKKKSVSK